MTFDENYDLGYDDDENSMTTDENDLYTLLQFVMF